VEEIVKNRIPIAKNVQEAGKATVCSSRHLEALITEIFMCRDTI